MPSRWARLRATAYVGVDQVRLVCMDESVTHPRVGFGRRRVVYRHYLPELARKPQAVRQVAPELLADVDSHGAIRRHRHDDDRPRRRAGNGKLPGRSGRARRGSVRPVLEPRWPVSVWACST